MVRRATGFVVVVGVILASTALVRAGTLYSLYGSGDTINTAAEYQLTNRLSVGTASAGARLYAQEGTIGNEVFRAESAATNDDPNFRIFHSRGTTTAGALTNIDFSLTTAAPTLAPCPSNSVCSVEAEVICHCTGGASCTANDGAGSRLMMYLKNNGGTISKLGSVLTLASLQPSAGSISSITLDTSTTNARVGVTAAAAYSHTCHVNWTVKNVGT